MATKQIISPDAIIISPSSMQLETSSIKSVMKPKPSIERKSITDTSPKSTVLLRQALPKYSFQVKKKNKHQIPNDSKDESLTKPLSTDCALQHIPSIQTSSNISSPNGHTELFSQKDLNEPCFLESAASLKPDGLPAEEKFGEKPMNRVGPLQVSTHEDQISHSNNSMSVLPVLPLSPVVCNSISWPSSKEVELLKEENVTLQSQLDVQLKVNTELKKLLVASVGEDLHYKVENLARDRAELTNEVKDYLHRMTEGYEHIDRVSIQADMWRSKFLASRMMADDLARANAFYSMQYQESQNAILQLLNERHELQTNLKESYRDLLTVKSAFDPLNTQKSTCLLSGNNIDLVKANRQLSETIKFRLLPSNISLHLGVHMEPGWGNDFTKAEAYANELISKQVRAPEFSQAPLLPPSSMTVDRFHPCTRYDNLTFNCCDRCKGEIIVV